MTLQASPSRLNGSFVRSITEPLALWARLLWQCWPQLVLIACVGMIGHDLLMKAAITVGVRNAVGGMVVLAFVVLLKLVVLVLMFAALRPHLPALMALREPASASAAPAGLRGAPDRFLAVTAGAILPFFAYYAAWGFLGDTVREYSRAALARVQAGEAVDVFALVQSRGAFLAVLACWAVRFLAKSMNGKSGHPFWRLLIVAADTSWVFIGLYALSVWKDEVIRWLGAGAFLEQASLGFLAPVTPAFAAQGFVPVEFRPNPWGGEAQNLFFYALLPMVWLVMAAIINGYELSAPNPTPLPSAGGGWRKWLRDFAGHFWGGYRSRYRPVWLCLKLTLGAGLATLVTFVLAYRLIGWADAWAWYGVTRWVGAHDLHTWQVLADLVSTVLGSPSELQGGILLEPMRVTLLAATLEYAVRWSGIGRGI